ncbi:hypothetical protein PCE1_001427 [Barthelona sp. PCE]
MFVSRHVLLLGIFLGVVCWANSTTGTHQSNGNAKSNPNTVPQPLLKWFDITCFSFSFNHGRFNASARYNSLNGQVIYNGFLNHWGNIISAEIKLLPDKKQSELTINGTLVVFSYDLPHLETNWVSSLQYIGEYQGFHRFSRPFGLGLVTYWQYPDGKPYAITFPSLNFAKGVMPEGLLIEFKTTPWPCP